MNFIKIKAFFTLKDTVNEVKWQAKHCKKIFTIHATDKKFISKLHNKLPHINNK